MAITWSSITVMYKGPRTFVYADAVLDSSYAAGGEAIAPGDLGLSEIHALWPVATAGYNATYSKTSPTAGKLAIYAALTPDTNSALSAPLDSSVGRAYSTVTISCMVIGV